jgi:hypothetical protein
MSSPSFEPTTTQAEIKRHAPVAAWWHTVVLIVIVLGISAYQGDPAFLQHATQLHSRLPIYVATFAYEVVLFLYVWLLGLLPRGVRIGEIIGGKWSRFQDFAIDVAVAMLFWIVVVAVLTILELALKFRGMDAARPLLPQTGRELAAFVILAVTAGFCEEFVFRGYLQRQFLALAQRDWIANVLQAIIFGAAHLYQGWRAVIAITAYGALFGILAAMRKSLRPGMMQHAAQDGVGGIVWFLATKYKMIPY